MLPDPDIIPRSGWRRDSEYFRSHLRTHRAFGGTTGRHTPDDEELENGRHHVTEIPFINAAAIVTRQRLESIGFKVILKGMDWSTNLVVRARKEPPDKGGWNLLHTWWLAADVSNPAVHFGVSGAGTRAWFGWPDIPELEKLVADWVRATDQTRRKQLADEVQKVALSEVPYVPWGEWVQPAACRKNVQDIVQFGAPIFWNVKIT